MCWLPIYKCVANKLVIKYALFTHNTYHNTLYLYDTSQTDWGGLGLTQNRLG